jgi:hypothetical protein
MLSIPFSKIVQKNSVVPAYRINLDCICEILPLHGQPIKYLVGIIIIIKVKNNGVKTCFSLPRKLQAL